MFPVADDLPDLSKFEVKPKSKTRGDETVARVVDDELSKLGWSENARLSLLGDLGRENGWNRDIIFGGHNDPDNKEFNRGIISWQKDRRENLDNYLKAQGVYGKRNDDELRGMVRFLDEEMKSSPEWREIHKSLRSPQISTYDASENLRKYIKYEPDAPYNSADDQFRVKNNRSWAEKARQLGLGKLPDLSPFEVGDTDLPDLSAFELTFEDTDTPAVAESQTAPNSPLELGVPQYKPIPTFPAPVIPDTVKTPEINPLENLNQNKKDLERQLSLAKTLDERKTIRGSISKLNKTIAEFENQSPVTENVNPSADASAVQSPNGLTAEQRAAFESPVPMFPLTREHSPVIGGGNPSIGKHISTIAKAAQNSSQSPIIVQPPQPETAQNNVPTPVVPGVNQTPKTPLVEAGTDAEILAGGAGIIKVDLARKPKGVNTSRWLEAQALKRIAPQYNLTDAEIEEYLNQSRQIGGNSFYDSVNDRNLPETLKSLKSAYGDTNVEVSVRNQAINEILNRRNGGQGINQTLRNEIDYQSNLTAQGLAKSQNNADIYRTEEEAKRKLTERAGEGDYAAQQVASEYLGSGDFFADIAKGGILGQMFGGKISDKGEYVLSSLGSDVPPPSDEWVKSELDRLRTEHGDFTKAWKAEEYYQNASNLEKFLRTSNQAARSFAKNLFSGTAKGLVFVSDLFEDLTPVNQLLPDKAKIGVRNAANAVDFAVRLLTSPSSKDAIDFFQNKWVSADAPLDQNQFFRAAQAFDEAVGDDPVLKGRLLGSLGDAGGSALSFIALGMLTPGLSVSTRLGEFGLSSAVAGGLQSAGTGYEEGKNAGLSETKAKAFGVIQGLLGATEGFGIGGQIGEIVKSPQIRRSLIEGILEVAKKGAWAEGKEEFFQEVFQTTGGKIALEALKDKDPSAWNKLKNALNRLPAQLAETVTNEGLIAFATGGMMGTATHAAQTFASRKTGVDNATNENLTEIATNEPNITEKNGDENVADKPAVRESVSRNDADINPGNSEKSDQPPVSNDVPDAAAQPVTELVETTRKPRVKEDLTGKTVINTDQVKGTVVKEQGEKSIIVDWENGRRSATGKKRVAVVEMQEPATEQNADSVSNNSDDLREPKRDVLEPAAQKPANTGQISGNAVRESVKENKSDRLKFERFKLPARKSVNSTSDVQSDVQSKVDDSSTSETKPREFSSTQVDLSPELSKEVLSVGRNLIKDADVHPEEGRETEPHITVKFGLHTNDAEDVRKILANEKPFDVRLGKVSIFDTNPEYDVVKVDVESPELHRLNKLIADNTEVTDTHPEYKPHLTLAYVKKGKGAQYVGNTALKGKEISFDSITFSGKDRQMIAVPLGGKAVNKTPEAANKPPQNPKEDLSKIGEMGSSIVENMYAAMWEKVEKGETREAGQESAILQIAKKVRDAGGLQTLEEFTKFGKEYGDKVANKKGHELQRAARTMVEKWSPKTESQTDEKVAKKSLEENAKDNFADDKNGDSPQSLSENAKDFPLAETTGKVDNSSEKAFDVKAKSKILESYFFGDGAALKMGAKPKAETAPASGGKPLFKVVGKLAPKHLVLQNRYKNHAVKSDLLPFVESYADGDQLKVSIEAGEVWRIVTATVNDDNLAEAVPVSGLFLDEISVEAGADILTELADLAESKGQNRTTLDKMKADLLEAAKTNGTVLVNIFDDAIPHEKIHQKSYLGAGSKDLAGRYKNLDELVTGEDDNSISFRVAFEEWAAFENRNIEIDDVDPLTLGVAGEEIFAYLSTGDHEFLGLSLDEAADLIIELGTRYAQARIDENPELSVKDALATFDGTEVADLLAQIKELNNEDQNAEIDSGNGNDESSGGKSGQKPGSFERGSQTADAQEKSGEGKPAAKSGTELKERQTILSAEKAGLVEENAITGDARYYAEKSRNSNERKAQEKIEEIGLSKAFTESVTKQPTEGERAEHIALQQEIVKLLNRQSSEAADAGNLIVAKAKLAESHEVVSAMAHLGTDYGQAISQFANLQKTDPDAVTGYVQKRRAQNQYRETLTPEQAIALRESAEELQKANAELKILEDKIAALEKKLENKKAPKNPVQKVIAEDLKKNASEAADRLREKFSLPASANQVLKMSSPLAEKQTAQLDPETLADFSTVGANILLSESKEKPISLSEFKKQFKEMFGPEVLPHIAEIHALSVAELKKVKSAAYRARAVEALRHVEGNEDLTVDDLNAIVEKRIEQRKENAKIRAEHQKESNKFFREKEKAEKLDDLPNFAKSLFKVADTQNKEALVGALYLETGQVKTADELARKLRESFPDLTPREALNAASIAARSRKLAHEDLKAEKAKTAQKIDAATAEMREAKKKRNEAQRQLLNRIKYLENPPPSYSQRIGRVYKAALVSAVQTQVNNFLTAQGTRKIVAATDLFEVLFNKGLAKAGLEYDYENKLSSKTRLQDVAGLPFGEDFSAADVVKHFFSDFVFARGIAKSVLDEYPTFYEAMFGSYASDVAVLRDRKGADGAADWTLQKVENAYEKVNVLGYLQEFLVRSQEFNHALQLRLGAKGMNLFDIIKNDKITEQITEEDLQFAVNRALTTTFALKPDKQSGFGKLTNLYQEHTPGIISPFLVTFPNFLYNATKFVTDYAPAVGLAKAGLKTIKSGDSFGQALIKQVNPHVVAQQLVGTTLFLAAFGLVRSLGDDDKWYYLKIPTSDFYIDVRGYQPFASMVFLANKFNRYVSDKPIFTDSDTATGEILEAMTGFSTRNLAENKMLQISEYGIKVFSEKIGAYNGDEKDWDRLCYVFKQQFGEMGGGFLRPFKTVKDLIAQFDDFEAKVPDTTERPGSQGIARSLPFSNRLLSLEPKKDFVTGKETSQPAPALKVLGVNLVNLDYHKEIPSKALVALREMTDNFTSEKDPLPESQRKAATKGSIYRAMREAGDDKEKQKKVNEAIKHAEEKGILEAGEIEFIERQNGLSEIQNLAKRAKPEQIERVLKFATDKEKSLLEPILEIKKENKEKEKEKAATDKLINQVRRGEISFEDADKVLNQQLEEGKISEKQYAQRIESTLINESQETAKNLDASSNADFVKIENFVNNLAPEDREGVYNILLEKTVTKLKSKDAKTLNEAERLYKIIEKNFPDFEMKK